MFVRAILYYNCVVSDIEEAMETTSVCRCESGPNQSITDLSYHWRIRPCSYHIFMEKPLN